MRTTIDMRKVFQLGLFLFLAMGLRAQNAYFQGLAWTSLNVPGSAQGTTNVIAPIPYAQIKICVGFYLGTPCSAPTATVYQDQAGTKPYQQPLTADASGNFSFWAVADTGLFYTVTGTNVQAQSYDLFMGGGPGATCGGTTGPCILSNPTASQTVSQPANTTFAFQDATTPTAINFENNGGWNFYGSGNFTVDGGPVQFNGGSTSFTVNSLNSTFSSPVTVEAPLTVDAPVYSTTDFHTPAAFSGDYPNGTPAPVAAQVGCLVAGTLTNCATSATTPIGIVDSIASPISGYSIVDIAGHTACNFDGTAVVGDVVTTSTTTAGECHDTGSTNPSVSNFLGIVVAANTGAGTAGGMVLGSELAGGGAPGCLLGNCILANPTASQTVSQPAATTFNVSGSETVSQSLGTPAILPTTLYSAAGTPLPACAVGIQGETAVVKDATAPSYMGAYTSGGAITAAVICSYNGTTYSWLTH